MFTLLTGIRPDAPGEEPVPAWVTAGIVMVFGGLTIWLAAKTHQGRNWARWALLGYLMLGWWLSSSELTEQFMRSPLVGFIDVLCIGMELAACGLLFGGQSAAWFTDLARTREPPGR
ncbi:hypothetical protein [Aquabacterium sp.]|uniref:hypothetical protein n=1 Tax=Aquabacterium sp. TaxID=1872578 RepID=UPI002C86843A|nr:hypothetical protein [Aquabacterium sp.]HSW04964.1 hypothetical protein [Aquabacterium sp.]